MAEGLIENVTDRTILLVDDESDITNLIEEVLLRDGFKNIIKVDNGKDAISVCNDKKPDIIVLDVMLPDIDGIEVCRHIRTFSYAPILFLSSKNDDIDKILGLSSGGDDYVTKPFSPRELVFRIKAQLRRQQYHQSELNTELHHELYDDASDHASNQSLNTESVQDKIIQIGALTLDKDACCVYKDDRLLELTAREFNMLQYFMENPNKIISKERLYEHVWGEISVVCDNTIMVHIRHLREKIELDPSNPEYLITVKGLGYKMIKEKV